MKTDTVSVTNPGTAQPKPATDGTKWLSGADELFDYLRGSKEGEKSRT